ncbi:MAG: NAD(P)/FAD-dependent oxidoreductase [Burkholderiales bacterium]|nr:NAD(P)/FAD-dependent oxidoreductase [Burkholderiales bacterium]
MAVTRRDAIVIGGGPAGLSAASVLAQAGHEVLLLEKESFGGWVMNLERVMDYPVRGETIAGNELATRMIERATECGVRLQVGEVVEVESYSRTKAVTCSDGKTYSAPALVLAGGRLSAPLGVPGEQALAGKGVIHCAACDAGLYAGKTVAVCGGGRAGLVEALLLAKYAARVHVLEAQAQPSAPADDQERARAHPRIDIRCGVRPLEVRGETFVTGLQIAQGDGEALLAVDGVLVHVGFTPATPYLRDLLALDEGGYVVTGEGGATGVSGIFAAGDIRRGAARTVAAAESDGAAAATAVRRYLEESKQ